MKSQIILLNKKNKVLKKEIEKLEEDIANWQNEIRGLEAELNNPDLTCKEREKILRKINKLRDEIKEANKKITKKNH